MGKESVQYLYNKVHASMVRHKGFNWKPPVYCSHMGFIKYRPWCQITLPCGILPQHSIAYWCTIMVFTERVGISQQQNSNVAVKYQ
ncbi:hypothetical protein GDO86_010504 [Hymenochirus boettgeri]|uniref:Uncharacterized protein n=1 Tax=Hymenochirus boettgeri TaxID=247094 RepID=A0A8T2JTB1_9PIPI|nr:hypothetical protein GDO86_010504 [Hymenochirus boettgeri]